MLAMHDRPEVGARSIPDRAARVVKNRPCDHGSRDRHPHAREQSHFHLLANCQVCCRRLHLRDPLQPGRFHMVFGWALQ
jgi:hypothetical protein